MQTFLIIVMALCICGMLFCIFMQYRNNWTFKKQSGYIQRSYGYSVRSGYKHDYLDFLPDYGKVFWRFWIWDYKKFFKGMDVPKEIIGE